MPLIQELDYGTPAVTAEKPVTLTIDGHDVTVPEGTSVMRAAMEAGIKVPKLCATDTLKQLRKLPSLPGGDRGAAPARPPPAPRWSHPA